MKLKRLSVDDIMELGKLGPCRDYPRERVEVLWGRRKRLSVAEILRLDIPAVDRVWVATRRGVLPDATLRSFAADCLVRMFRRVKARGAVLDKRRRQDKKWGVQRHRYPLYRLILGEEIGEMDRAWLHTQFGGEDGGREKLREEMVQACAVLMAMIETGLECGQAFVGPHDANAAGEEVEG